ncbi:MAG: hypothetical protein HUN05_02055 [Desulfobacter sp.]|nr:MAG: hypothetical protein HUN05_02055 [Desulfobacter sp.]
MYLNILNTLVEHADTRSWRTLPGQIYMRRFFLPPGQWQAAMGTRDRKIHKNLLQGHRM